MALPAARRPCRKRSLAAAAGSTAGGRASAVAEILVCASSYVTDRGRQTLTWTPSCAPLFCAGPMWHWLLVLALAKRNETNCRELPRQHWDAGRTACLDGCSRPGLVSWWWWPGDRTDLRARRIVAKGLRVLWWRGCGCENRRLPRRRCLAFSFCRRAGAISGRRGRGWV